MNKSLEVKLHVTGIRSHRLVLAVVEASEAAAGPAALELVGLLAGLFWDC
jgi:hypothetical protein